MSLHRFTNGSVVVTDDDGDQFVAEAPNANGRLYIRAIGGAYLDVADRRALATFLLDGLEAGQ